MRSQECLEFSFELVTKDTFLEGAELNIIEVPVTVFCVPCDQEVELPGIQSFRCPICDTPSADIRQGKELDVESLRWSIDNAVDKAEIRSRFRISVTHDFVNDD